LKLLQAEACSARSFRTWLVRNGSTWIGKEADPVWIRNVASVWPVDWPSRCDGSFVWILYESLLACHSIRFSRFRRSEAIHYRCRHPLSITFLDRSRRRPSGLLRCETLPPFGRERRPRAGVPASLARPRYPIALTDPLSFKTRSVSEYSGTSSPNNLPSLQRRCKWAGG